MWDRAWLNDRRVTDLTCDSSQLALSPGIQQLEDITTQQPLDGQAVSHDPMSTEIETYTDFALAVIEEQSNADDKLKVTKILASSVQVVEGKNVRLTLEVGATRCSKRDQEVQDCPVDASKDIQICNIQIWDRAWLQEKQVMDLNCRIKRAGRSARSEDFDESPFVGDTPRNFRLGTDDLMLPSKASRASDDEFRQESLPILGGYTDAQVNDTHVVEIASFAAEAVSQSLNAGNSNAESYALVKIHSASTQVVAGINYKLQLELGRSDGSILCNVIVFDQSWTSTRQVTNMTCFPQALPPPPSNGTFRPAELNDEGVRGAAAFATAALTKTSPDSPYTMVKVNSAARQGSNYKLTLQLLQSGATVLCDVLVSDGSSLTSSSCSGPKRQRQLSGGYSKADVKDFNVQEMAKFATSMISQSSNEGDLSLVKVSSASRQIVSGVNYKLTLKLRSATGTQTCHVVVYDQSWTKTRKLTSFDCKNPVTGARTNRQLPKTKTRRPISRPIVPLPPPPSPPTKSQELSVEPPPHCQAGGYCPVDPNEKAVKEMAAFATTTLSQSSNSGPLTLTQVKSAARQVVAGFSYRVNTCYISTLFIQLTHR